MTDYKVRASVIIQIGSSQPITVGYRDLEERDAAAVRVDVAALLREVADEVEGTNAG